MTEVAIAIGICEANDDSDQAEEVDVDFRQWLSETILAPCTGKANGVPDLTCAQSLGVTSVGQEGGASNAAPFLCTAAKQTSLEQSLCNVYSLEQLSFESEDDEQLLGRQRHSAVQATLQELHGETCSTENRGRGSEEVSCSRHVRTLEELYHSKDAELARVLQHLNRTDYELDQALKALREKERENDHLATVNRLKGAELAMALDQKTAVEKELSERLRTQADIIFTLKADLSLLHQRLAAMEGAVTDDDEDAICFSEAGVVEQSQACPAAVPQQPTATPSQRSKQKTRRQSDMRKRIAELELQVEKLRECPICWVEAKQCVYECGHQTCFTCGDQLQACPLCREPITKRIRLY
mmetsp:Transcript_37179/g.82699  ORF Transcript_37179/g.82699 Transcript_37179/m.82699 type:complete len:355 (-) Transcript_37179:1440-2504(-)